MGSGQNALDHLSGLAPGELHVEAAEAIGEALVLDT
jgi:hypothetical protein